MTNELVGTTRSRVCIWAVVSLICGVLGLVTGLAAILAIVFGHIAMGEISRNTELYGSGMAIAGLILGYLVITIILIGILFFGGLAFILKILLVGSLIN